MLSTFSLLISPRNFAPLLVWNKQGAGGRRGGGGTQQSLIPRGSAPRSHPLPFQIPFLTEKLSLSYTFLDKWYPRLSKSPSSDFIWRGTSSLAVGRFAAKQGSLRSPRGRLVASLIVPRFHPYCSLELCIPSNCCQCTVRK